MRLRCGEAGVGARQIALAHSIVSLHQLTAHTARRLNLQRIGSLITLTGSGHCSLHRHRLIAHCIGLLHPCIGSLSAASAHSTAHCIGLLRRITRRLTASAVHVMWCASVHCSVLLLGDAGPASVRPGLSCSHLPLIMPERTRVWSGVQRRSQRAALGKMGGPEPGGGTGCFGNVS